MACGSEENGVEGALLSSWIINVPCVGVIQVGQILTIESILWKVSISPFQSSVYLKGYRTKEKKTFYPFSYINLHQAHHFVFCLHSSFFLGQNLECGKSVIWLVPMMSGLGDLAH